MLIFLSSLSSSKYYPVCWWVHNGTYQSLVRTGTTRRHKAVRESHGRTYWYVPVHGTYWICIWWYSSKQMLPEYLQSYMSCNQYVLVCTLYVLSTYQYELELPNSFWRYYVFTFDNEKGYCVYGTGTWWCLNSKKVPDFRVMAIKHVILVVPVHWQTQYIPVHTSTCMYQGVGWALE